MLTLMFPGQGAQRRGMGEELFGEFESLVAAGDAILGYSLRELCMAGDGRLDQTQYTQPALYVVNALSYLKRSKAGRRPDALIGHSLGEFNALLAAEVFDFETGLRLVQARGKLMSEAVGGGMAAVMRLDSDALRRTLTELGLDGIDLANFNAPGQIVVSGRREDIERAGKAFVERGIGFVPLNTGGAFHSRYMADAKERFDAELRTVQLRAPKLTVIANYDGRPYTRENAHRNLSQQIMSPVWWSEGIQYLMSLGDMDFEEVGGTRVLTNLVGKIKAQAPSAAPPKPQQAVGEKPSAAQRSESPNPAEPASPVGAGPEPAERSGPINAEEKVRRWNSRHRIGTKVRSGLIRGSVLQTRTQAVVLFGHRAGVYLENYHGYFDLDELDVVGGA